MTTDARSITLDDLLTPVDVGQGVTLRLLPPAEWGRLFTVPGPLQGLPLPADGAARILVAEAAGTIVGYWCLTAVVHLDPVYIAPEYRQSPKLVLGLVGLLITLLRVENVAFAYAVIGDADQPVNGEMAEKLGLSRLPGALYGGAIPQGDL